jgi:hypothetical protein
MCWLRCCTCHRRAGPLSDTELQQRRPSARGHTAQLLLHSPSSGVGLLMQRNACLKPGSHKKRHQTGGRATGVCQGMHRVVVCQLSCSPLSWNAHIVAAAQKAFCNLLRVKYLALSSHSLPTGPQACSCTPAAPVRTTTQYSHRCIMNKLPGASAGTKPSCPSQGP